MKIEKIEGLVAAPFTPMHPDGSLNLDIVPDYYNLLEKNGVKGAFICGSTGEGVSMTQKERISVTAAWGKQSTERKTLKLISLVGGTSYNECIENAIASRQYGMDAIAILAPYYFKPASVQQLADFCARIGEAVPDMPVYFYHIPVLTGCGLPMIDFLKAIEPLMPNFAGVKYTHEDFMDFLSCLNYKDGKYDMLWGRDENMLSALVLGTRGAIGSTFNYAAPLYHALTEAYDKGDFVAARKLQQLSINMIMLLGRYGGIATGKAYMRYIGLDCGYFRLPIKNMDETMFNKFKADVQALGMEQWFSKL